MKILTTAFQYEVRYNHILNFSQIARKMLAPYVRLASSITVENQNTIEERIILRFEEDDYLIIVNWDRILIKGQGNLKVYTEKNSPIETPFFTIVEDIKKLTEFGSIRNVLLAINYIKKIDATRENLADVFAKRTMLTGVSNILDKYNDAAIIIESKIEGEEKAVTFGPYFGTNELLKRKIVPVNLGNLGETEFSGVMLEYKHYKVTNNASFNDFVTMIKTSNDITDKVWEML